MPKIHQNHSKTTPNIRQKFAKIRKNTQKTRKKHAKNTPKIRKKHAKKRKDQKNFYLVGILKPETNLGIGSNQGKSMPGCLFSDQRV